MGRARLSGKLASGPKSERGREENFPFLFLKHIFKTKFNSNLNPFAILIKPKHHKNKYAAACMHKHVARPYS